MINPLIALEGLDGSGKSSIAKALHDHLTELSLPSVLTREPGGCPVAEQLRSIILDPDSRLQPKTELALFLVARYEHLYKTIFPNLQQGKIVVCDRFLGSSLAYQGTKGGLSVEVVQEMTKLMLGEYEVMHKLTRHLLTFVIDIPYEVAIERLVTRATKNHLDVLDKDDFQSKRKIFLYLNNHSTLYKYLENFHVLDGTISIDENVKKIVTIMKGASS